MLCLHLLADLLQKYFRPKLSQTRPCTRLWLEALEERVVPWVTGPVGTYTNATAQITPNWASLSVNETITATVTLTPYYLGNGQTLPIPSGYGTPPGVVVFNLNNQQQTATLDANGQATTTFHLPLLALLGSQQLTAYYRGSGQFSGVGEVPPYYSPSTFDAPLYLNPMNFYLPATLTFGQQLNTQQQYGTSNASLPSFYTALGETDNFGLLSFQYVDPGILTNFTALGINIPLDLFVLAAAASGSSSSPSSTSSSS